MGIQSFVPVPSSAKHVARFVELFLLDQSARDYFGQEELRPVVQLAKEGDWVSAARLFGEVTGADPQMRVFAAQVAAKV